MKGPKVSVIMPVYNSTKYVRHPIESVLCQSYGDFEFVIIDDNSQDDSFDIIGTYDHP